MTTSSHDTIETIAAFVGQRFPTLRGATERTALIASGALDSLGIVELMAFLEERFSISFDEIEIGESDFESIGSLARFVDSIRVDA